MLRGSCSPITHVYYFLRLLFIRIETKGLKNLWKPCWRTENSLKKAHQKYEEEVKRCYFDLSDKKLIDDNYLTLYNSINFFRYYEERHSTNWTSIMKEMLPIFISPVVLNKSCYDSGEKNSQRPTSMLHGKRFQI
jgi:hypothetical protein